MGQKKENRNYAKEYAREKINAYKLTLNLQKTTDSNIINQINKRVINDSYTKQGYIKALIRCDIDNDVLSKDKQKQ